MNIFTLDSQRIIIFFGKKSFNSTIKLELRWISVYTKFKSITKILSRYIFESKHINLHLSYKIVNLNLKLSYILSNLSLFLYNLLSNISFFIYY